MSRRWSASLALGWTVLLLAGCQGQTEPARAPVARANDAAPPTRTRPAGKQQVTLHVPDMTRRLDLA